MKKYFGVKKNVYALGLVSMLNDMSNEMIHPILPIFLLTIGAPIYAIGLIEGIANSVASIFELISGWYSDKIGKRKPFVAGGYTISVTARSLLAFSTIWTHVLGIRIFDRVGKGMRTSPRDAIISDTKKKMRGRSFGVQRALDQLGAVLGPLVVILLLTSFSYRNIFLLAIIPGILTIPLLIFFVKEPKKKKNGKIKFGLKMFSKNYRKFIFIAGVFALANFSFAFLILRANEIGISVQYSTLLYLIFTLVSSIMAVPMGVLSDKIGRKYVISLGFLLFGLMCFGFAYVNSFLFAILLFAMYGFFIAINKTIPRTFVSDMVKSRHRGTAIGTFHTVIGLAALPSSAIAGIMWQMFGSSVVFYFGAVIAFISTILILTFIE